ncbi:MarR family transcriptional regulator [Aestuariicella sp. G3-2]|uniref:MarR family winged helix-turn-helix transcriptional regulator n=1 Tax=Pseudomaricurvus albidus TaxID=2842452 RepID=UPI001C0D3B44|nr:MarR family transcriptional regulator [Aestuariicella albida]MBU3068295.1 MarR family transcriptional regulator [Aestuariicella albida]
MNDSPHIPFATLMADIHRMFSTSLYRQLKADGINLSRSQWRILTHLRTQDGLTQSELAERLLIEKAPAGTLIDKLEAAGLVERRPDPNDRRANRVFITVKSEPLLPLIEQTVTELKMQCMAGISEEEQHQLNQTLTRIHLNLQAIRNPSATTEETG